MIPWAVVLLLPMAVVATWIALTICSALVRRWVLYRHIPGELQRATSLLLLEHLLPTSPLGAGTCLERLAQQMCLQPCVDTYSARLNNNCKSTYC
jgi:hypothetical protein